MIRPDGMDGAAGNVAVIAAGTGLGESALAWEDGRYYPVVSEGGHSSFAPDGDDQIELLRFLAREFGHVSCERVLSGPGTRQRVPLPSRAQRRRGAAVAGRSARRRHPAASISSAAMDGRDKICVDALAMFCALYGSEAANLALKVLAIGGVYLCGGIAPENLAGAQARRVRAGFYRQGPARTDARKNRGARRY